ncbi:MAG: hypothetical protein ACI90V_009052, partial [Bacillariaceae sp.]
GGGISICNLSLSVVIAMFIFYSGGCSLFFFCFEVVEFCFVVLLLLLGRY